MNSYARQVVLIRAALRFACDVARSVPLEGKNSVQITLLALFRCALIIFTKKEYENAEVVAPIHPSRRPIQLTIRNKRDKFGFSLVSIGSSEVEANYLAYTNEFGDLLLEEPNKRIRLGLNLLQLEASAVLKSLSIGQKDFGNARADKLKKTPLWRNIKVTDELPLLLADLDHFRFWIEWYQGLLDGKPIDWDLQKRVALIPDRDWGKGPEHIARKIEEIEAAYLAEKLPQAEHIEFNPETARFRAVPIPVEKADLLGATLSQVEDALDDALANPSNGLSERSREARVLRRTVAKYGNDPQRIEMDLTSVHGTLTRQIASEDLPPSEENLALQNACAEGARAIRATHPEVAENRAILSEQAWRELTPAAKAQLEQSVPILVAASEDDLADQFREDIPELINDAIGPVPDYAPKLPGADPATRIFSRVSKMTIILRQSNEALEAISKRSGLTKGEVISIFLGLVSIGISLL
ncbi:hypothetical protein [Rhodovulum marinum]|uniref:hypothetical protein n=1 Tax=Rhodovulum marinum TaxID=320662 RepID=UPI0010487705|nr:hypothetical protein [Rhodovulum marinum]